jgi:peptidoglycan/LPS O-acetylase OafA/YrhL
VAKTVGTNETIKSIQILRAIAALGVVYTHCRTEGGFTIKNTGEWGVDMFFIISGFIIAYIVSRDTKNFMIKRICRIVPLYFIATFLVIFVAVVFPDLVHGTRISSEKIIKSLCFIPYKDEFKQDLPILGQGWTLRFEMFFYLIMTFCIFVIKNKEYLTVGCSLTLILFLFVLNIVKSDFFIFEYYRDGLFPEFIVGLLLYPMYDYLKQRTDIFKLNKNRFIMIIMIGIAIASLGFLIGSDIRGFYFSTNRNMRQGIPSLVIVMALLFIENNINGQNRCIRFMVLMGEASYAMYLFHYHIIAFLTRIIFPKVSINNRAIGLLELLFTITVTIIISIYVYKLVDIPIQKGIRRLIKK